MLVPCTVRGSQRQLCKGQAMTQIFMICFVSLVAPEGARQALPTGSARNNLYQHVCHCVSLYKGHAMTQI